jgi:hypothetical protein
LKVESVKALDRRGRRTAARAITPIYPHDALVISKKKEKAGTDVKLWRAFTNP